jgi:hypothetical protein
LTQNHLSELFFLLFLIKLVVFTYFQSSFICFCDFVVFAWPCLFWYLFLCAVCFWFVVLVRCLFDSCWTVSFEQVHIQSITLASSTLQTRKREYSRDLNIVIFVGLGTMSFYAININVVILFAYSFFLFLATLNLYCIDVISRFEWMNIVYFLKKKRMSVRMSVEKSVLLVLLKNIISGVVHLIF